MLFSTEETRQKLKVVFQNIFNRYSRSFEEDDEIDIMNMEVVHYGRHLAANHRVLEFGSVYKHKSKEKLEGQHAKRRRVAELPEENESFMGVQFNESELATMPLKPSSLEAYTSNSLVGLLAEYAVDEELQHPREGKHKSKRIQPTLEVGGPLAGEREEVPQVRPKPIGRLTEPIGPLFPKSKPAILTKDEKFVVAKTFDEVLLNAVPQAEKPIGLDAACSGACSHFDCVLLKILV